MQNLANKRITTHSCVTLRPIGLSAPQFNRYVLKNDYRISALKCIVVKVFCKIVRIRQFNLH